MSPYIVLGVAEGSSDSEIKSAYQGLVRDYSPDRFPDIFQDIRSAYEQIKDNDSRVIYEYFINEKVDAKSICSEIISNERFSLDNGQSFIKKYSLGRGL